ncbi:MAG: 5-(carboxyamino)imidazole ribonucleotide mutase [Candidatus Omnitrophica bacterium]|nr:5-(carboxyamino)imidazole ribonucleotide mutase [Candidatus Omnitrophota bacterium]
MNRPLVSIVMGSDSDLPTLMEASNMLKEFGVPHEVRILSAHRFPKGTALYAEGAERRGIRVIIAAAGGAAHLAGVIAAHTSLPVIGVPIETKSLKGIDSLFSTVQMPPGVPVGTMAIGKSGAKNAGVFAAEILATHTPALRRKLHAYKKKLARGVRLKNLKMGFRFP